MIINTHFVPGNSSCGVIIRDIGVNGHFPCDFSVNAGVIQAKMCMFFSI